MEILTLGNETLKMKAAPIADLNADVFRIAADMLEAMKDGRGIGLAGPQVGLLMRLFVIQLDRDQARVFINPSIVQTSEELSEYEEGCLSVPGMYAEVIRPAEVRVQAWNERGRPFTIDADGLLARVILHEYDHLEGTLFIDRLPQMKRDRLVGMYERKKRA